MMERLSSSGIQLEESLEERIQIFANSQNLLLAKRDENEMETLKNLFTDFVRGFNTQHPLSVFEDTSVIGPSGAGGKRCQPSSSIGPCSIADC